MRDEPWALVTGASRGLGAAIARSLSLAGYQVVVCARSRERLAALAYEATKEGRAIYPVVADVTDEESVDQMFSTILGLGGRVDLCVNNAGTNRSHQLVRVNAAGDQHRHPLAEWRETVDLSLTGTFLVGRGAAAFMLRQGSGVMVNISSSVRHGAFGQSAYAAAKAGVESLTRTWAHELGGHGIRVVAIAPGVLDGERLRERMANERHANYMAALQAAVPLQRWTRVEDVCSTVLLAARNESLTGTVLEVDCGGIPPRVRKLPPNEAL